VSVRRFLWASPLPPIRSGVSDYAVELLPELARHVQVRVLTPPGWQRPSDWPLPDTIELVPHGTMPEADETLLLHLGNNPYHTWIAELLGRHEAVAVLHDLVLHHLLVESTLGQGDREGYEQRLTAALGEPGAALARARRFGITGRRDPFLFPAWQAFLDQTSAAVVHSEWARRQLVAGGYRQPIQYVPLAAADPGAGVGDRAALRAELGVASDSVLLMHLGFLTPEKGVHEILSAVAAAHQAGVPVHLVLVGEGQALDLLTGLAGQLELQHLVTATGWVPAVRLPQLPAAADLGVVLRRPSAGETSAAVLRFLACGTPVAVSGHRQLLEWPEAAAPRLTPGPATAAELARLLARVATARDNGSWQQRRLAARSTYEMGHQPDQAATALAGFLDQL
jgi:glycosyltransferase involved in cell wall biosynthesis